MVAMALSSPEHEDGVEGSGAARLRQAHPKAAFRY